MGAALPRESDFCSDRTLPSTRLLYMATLSAPFSNDTLMQAYGRADIELRLHQAKVCSVLSLVLVPACIGLDYFAYPELLGKMFVARLICDLALLPCFLALFTTWGRRHVHLLGNAPPMIPGFAICWMIYASEGVFSPYYAGLNIVLVGVILLIPYTLTEAGIICAVVVSCYALACLSHRLFASPNHSHMAAGTGFSTFINNIYFLGMTTVLALAACHYTSQRRFQEFRLRYELDSKNTELASTLKKLQETEVQLVQSEKMNALGKLSAGLLHEINNPLNFTFMALQVAQQEVSDNISVLDTLKDIGEGMGRIRDVVSDLRAFAYPATQANSERFSMKDALTTALRLMSHELGELQIEQEGFDGADAMGVKTQIVHVLMNTLVNSVHAVKAEKSGRPHRISISCQAAGDRLAVKVRDNGIGVKAANLPRLCEPFFTTKEVGQGTGLGLSISHTIVKNHAGNLVITSEEGQWTEVTFDLPLAAVRSTI
jgi:two-component system sensor histidine kinase PhcS